MKNIHDIIIDIILICILSIAFGLIVPLVGLLSRSEEIEIFYLIGFSMGITLFTAFNIAYLIRVGHESSGDDDE